MKQTTRSLEDCLNELLQKSGVDISQISDGNNTFGQLREKKLNPIQAIQDDRGHWYIIPNELFYEFRKDNENVEMVNSGDFSAKYDEYHTGVDLNSTQLYIND